MLYCGNKFNYKMKTLLKRKPKNQPCRSPSPDIANRSIIKNTTIEVEDIRIKFRKAHENQIKFEVESSLSHIPEEHSDQNKYRELQQELNRLKNQNQALIEQNRILNLENSRVQPRSQSTKNINLVSAAAVSKQQHQILREKLAIAYDQNKKKQYELITQKTKVEQLRRDMQNLRLQKEFLEDNLNKHSQKYQYNSPQTPSNLDSEQQAKFVLYSHNMLRDYQNRVNNYLADLHSRINKLQMMEKILKERQERFERQTKINKTPTHKPIFNYWAASTNSKIDTQIKEYPPVQSQLISNFQQSASPMKAQDSLLDRVERENFNLREEIRLKNLQIDQLNMQKQNLYQIISAYENNKKGADVPPKFNNEIFATLSALEDELKRTRLYKDQCIRRNELLTQKLSYVQQNIEYERRDLHNKLQYQSKIIEELEKQTGSLKECFRCFKLQQENTYLKQLLNETKQKYETNYQKLKQTVLLEVSKNQRVTAVEDTRNNEKLKELEDRCHRLEGFNSQLGAQLKNHLTMLEYIKSILHVADFDDLLSCNQGIYTQVETALLSERQRHTIQIRDQEMKIQAKDYQIAQLQRDLKLKVAQVDLLKNQIQTIKIINLQSQSASIKKLTSELISSKHQNFSANSTEILQKVKTGSQKLEVLYQKMSNAPPLDVSSSSIIFF